MSSADVKEFCSVWVLLDSVTLYVVMYTFLYYIVIVSWSINFHFCCIQIFSILAYKKYRAGHTRQLSRHLTLFLNANNFDERGRHFFRISIVIEALAIQFRVVACHDVKSLDFLQFEGIFMFDRVNWLS